mmetsp:Transcript_106965/g.302478  ORF Transcript_106965/g.302478 Transcript_106965/m.302478 type:complete len:172 (-) Transcript_106965:61-576(-)
MARARLQYLHLAASAVACAGLLQDLDCGGDHMHMIQQTVTISQTSYDPFDGRGTEVVPLPEPTRAITIFSWTLALCAIVAIGAAVMHGMSTRASEKEANKDAKEQERLQKAFALLQEAQCQTQGMAEGFQDLKKPRMQEVPQKIRLPDDIRDAISQGFHEQHMLRLQSMPF